MNHLAIRSVFLSLYFVVFALGGALGQVRVALSVPMTGPLAFYGAQVEPAVRQAVDDLNQQGGVRGQPIDLIVSDDRCDPATALRQVQRSVEVDHASLVIGPICSLAAAATLQYLGTGNRTINILTSPSPSALTESGYSNLFRIVPRGELQGRVASTYLQSIRGNYNVAVLQDDTPYANEIIGALRRAWPNLDFATRYQSTYSVAQTDFTPIIERLRTSDIKVVYVAGVSFAMGSLIRQARAQGLQSLFVGSDTAALPPLLAVAGESVNGTLFNFFPDPTQIAQNQPILARMTQRGRQPSVYGLYAYAALQVWAKAATIAESVDPQRVASELHSRRLDTVIGSVAFDARGDVREVDYTFYEWREQRIVQLNHRPPPPPPPPR